MPKAKGTNLLHMRSFVEQAFGALEWDRVLAALAAEDRAVMEVVKPAGWYDLGVQHRLLRCVDSTVGSGDLALVPAIARHEADQDLSMVHRLFVRFTSPAYVLQKSGDYWRRFYDTGRWEVVRTSNSAVGRLYDFALVDEAFCSYLVAYAYRMFELAGARTGSLTHTECRARGGQACVFVGRWT